MQCPVYVQRDPSSPATISDRANHGVTVTEGRQVYATELNSLLYGANDVRAWGHFGSRLVHNIRITYTPQGWSPGPDGTWVDAWVYCTANQDQAYIIAWAG